MFWFSLLRRSGCNSWEATLRRSIKAYPSPVKPCLRWNEIIRCFGGRTQTDIGGKGPIRRIDVQPYEWFGFRVGQWKINFNRERVDSSGRQQFVERSAANRGNFTRWSSSGCGSLDGFSVVANENQYNINQYVPEEAYKHQGFSLQSEHHWKNISDDSTGLDHNYEGSYS
jgi:phosphate-selective porin